MLKATYKCLGCSHNYDAMDMDKIFDPVTEELRCWKCREVVEPDETSGPTDETRLVNLFGFLVIIRYFLFFFHCRNFSFLFLICA